MSKKITEQDIIDSVASACQYISFYHPEDFVKGMVEAYEAEKGEAVNAMAHQLAVDHHVGGRSHQRHHAADQRREGHRHH